MTGTYKIRSKRYNEDKQIAMTFFEHSSNNDELCMKYDKSHQTHEKVTHMQKDAPLRVSKIQDFLIKKNMDACILSTTVHMLYSNGRIFNGYMYIPVEGAPVRFVKRPIDYDDENVFFVRKPEQIPEILIHLGYPAPKQILLEGDEIGYTNWMRLQQCFPSSICINGSHDLRIIRSIKTDVEVDLIRKSAALHVKAYQKIPQVFRRGMTDIEFSIEIERLMRLEGNLGLFRTYGEMEAFMGSVLTGENADVASPYDFALGGAGHYTNPIGAAGLILSEGKSVMVDMAGNFTGYLDDLTRTFSIGKLSDLAYKAHETSIQIHLKLQELMKEGAKCEDLWETSLAIAKKAHLDHCYMGKKQQAKFVGHGVGLVINELPIIATKSKEVLKPNMTIAIEPKFVIDGVGAVGVEDTYLIQKNGCEQLTKMDFNIVDLTK